MEKEVKITPRRRGVSRRESSHGMYNPYFICKCTYRVIYIMYVCVCVQLYIFVFNFSKNKKKMKCFFTSFHFLF